LKKKQILRDRAVLERVSTAGRRIDVRLFRCYIWSEESTAGTLVAAFGVPSRGTIAVRRNRVRRLMREAFARESKPLAKLCEASQKAVSLLFVYRPSKSVDVRRLTLSAVRPEIAHLCQMAHDMVR
jgi:ribonuclease P protein component